MKNTPKDLSALGNILEVMQGKAVLVVGDIMLDRFIYGHANRISPESPVPVLSIAREEIMLGGAGNVLSNLSGLGCGRYLLSVVGDDDAGAQVRILMTERGADPADLISDPARPTTIKCRFLASNQQLLRTDFETSKPLPAKLENELLDKAARIIEKVQAVILSDYGKGTLTPRVIERLIEMAQTKNIPVLVDPKGKDYSLYKGADIITPNRKELSEATGGMKTKTDEDVIKAANHLMQNAGIKTVIATRSQDGMSIIGREEQALHLRVQAKEVFDVSGAGDTVISTIAASLAAGADITEAAMLANIAGGIVVGKLGTAPIRKEELQKSLSRHEIDISTDPEGRAAVIDHVREARICGREDAKEMIQRWQARGLKVGFTNGCFDILHSGHVNYLNRSRDKCDRLVIGLNADESVRRLKGETRPINNESSRATVLGALGAIDMVVIFGQNKEEQDTAASIIETLKPDIYFKGGDYNEEEIPEAAIVKAYGGEVLITDLYKGHSTTATIKRVKGEAA